MSRIVDEQGRVFGKVNVVDIVVVLALALLITFAIVRLSGGSTATAAVKVTVTFRVGQVQAAYVERLEKATGTVEDDSGTVLGEVAQVTDQATIEEVPSSSGDSDQPPTIYAVASPIYRDVDFTLTSQANKVNGTYRIGNVVLTLGKKVTLVGPGYSLQSNVRSVEEVK